MLQLRTLGSMPSRCCAALARASAAACGLPASMYARALSLYSASTSGPERLPCFAISAAFSRALADCQGEPCRWCPVAALS